MRKVKFLFIVVSMSSLVGCNKAAGPASSGADTDARSASSVGTIYYVSPTGNDSNNGTSASTPWKTIAKVNARTWSAGDEILFKGGQTFSGTIMATSSGSSGSDILYGSYGTGRATINAGAGDGIYVYNKSYIRIDNLVIHGGWDSLSQSGNSGAGIDFYTDLGSSVQLGEAYVSNCDVSGFQNGGVSFGSGPTDKSQSGYSLVTVYNNSVHDNGALGITTWGNQGTSGNATYCFRNVSISYNAVYNNYGVKSHTSGHTGDGIIIGQAGGGTVQNNSAYNNGWYCVAAGGGPAAIWCWDSKGLTFQYNIAHDNGTGNGVDGDGFDLDGGAINCIMQYNYAYNNSGAGYLLWEYGDTRSVNGNNVLRYNLSQNDGRNGNYGSIHNGPSCSNNLFYNNTIYNNRTSPVIVQGGTGNKFCNNIFFASIGQYIVYSTGTSAWFMDNDYYGGGYTSWIYYNGSAYSSLSAFRSGTGSEIYSGVNYGYFTNPGLAGAGSGNYHLNVGSPMINAGFNLTTWGLSVGSTDYYGAGIPYNGAYDVGASEYH